MDAAFAASFQRVDDALHNLTRCLFSYAAADGDASNRRSGLAERVVDSMGALSIEGDSSQSSCSPEALLSRLDDLRTQITDYPYSIPRRLQAAEIYRALGFPDLAAGEAYRALLLVDEVLDESGEYHERALETITEEVEGTPASVRAEHATRHGSKYMGISQRLEVHTHGQEKSDAEVLEDEALMWAEALWSNAAYVYVAGNLLACGCLKSAYEFCLRGLKSNPENAHLTTIRELLDRRLKGHFESRGRSLDSEDVTLEDYPERTSVRRELYPWNTFEPDRYAAESISLLNEQICAVAPKLEARITELPILTPDTDRATCQNGPHEPEAKTIKQLGVFVKEDIAPGEVILDEKSLLTANARLYDSYCDACSATLPDLHDGSRASQCVHCEDCDDVVFCSRDCHDLAQGAYHPALCGNDPEPIAKNPSAAEAADALYSLLLLRALAMAETQDIHPLDLSEVKYIWADYHIPSSDPVFNMKTSPLGPATDPFGGVPRTLPFTFRANILTPLHMLEKMDVNIFTTPQYDFWVVNALYAKFRGTASARQGRDGKPDGGAVHPLWCLANHSCDPNVRWEWHGNMRLWAREEGVSWKGKGEEARRQPGLRKGEEVLSHYCDVDLPAKERREWAVGALGGICMCERCVWEAGLEKGAMGGVCD